MKQSEPSSSCTSGLSGGKIAGVVIGTFIAAFASGCLVCCCFPKRKSAHGQQNKPGEGTPNLTEEYSEMKWRQPGNPLNDLH
jgi:hypothetical protein